MIEIAKPYVLFLGDVQDPLDAKTAMGLKEWRPEWCGAVQAARLRGRSRSA